MESRPDTTGQVIVATERRCACHNLPLAECKDYRDYRSMEAGTYDWGDSDPLGYEHTLAASAEDIAGAMFDSY